MTELVLIRPACRGREKQIAGESRLSAVLSHALADISYQEISCAEEFDEFMASARPRSGREAGGGEASGEPSADPARRKLLFAVELGRSGINAEYYRILERIRLGGCCLAGAVGGVIVDGESELFTKAVARELVFTANQAGCMFPGRPLAEGTAELQNFIVQANNQNTDRMSAYQTAARTLAEQIMGFEAPKKRAPKLLVLHANNAATSNTSALWNMIKEHLHGMEITEISLRNGAIQDCGGCPYTTCLHFGEKERCYYGGLMVEQVYPAVRECDGLLMLCPNYNDALSANLSAFINRLTALFRKMQFYDKYLFALVVSGYSGGDLVAGQLISALNMNKTFILPPRFCMLETANDPGSILKIPGIRERAADFAAHMMSTMMNSMTKPVVDPVMNSSAQKPSDEEPSDGGQPDAELAYLARICGPLLSWYHENRRILPWREEPTPYRVWISEIMLQQTRVEAGRDYFLRFVKQLPAIADLANVDDEALMKLWEGLGYYNRARNLKKAAGIVVEQYGGELPASYEALTALPGIGSYTAGAIASIAFGIKAPAVDGNVLRVISRIMARTDDITLPAVKKRMESELLAVMPADSPGDFNQALMELGATVCLPNGAPKCEVCPVRSLCRARAEDRLDEIPVKKKKKERRIEIKTVLILTDRRGRIALRKRPDTGLLAGMWELPSLEGALTREQAAAELEKQGILLTGEGLSAAGNAKHIFSHVEWHMTGYRGQIADAERIAGDVPKDQGDSAADMPAGKETPPALLLREDSTVYIKDGRNQKNETENAALVFADGAALAGRYALPSAFKGFRDCFQTEAADAGTDREQKNTEQI